MVDFRPLLFLNALALMLLVTAGFASIRDELPTAKATQPPMQESPLPKPASKPLVSSTQKTLAQTPAPASTPTPKVETVAKVPSEPETLRERPKVNTEPFRVPEPRRSHYRLLSPSHQPL